MPSMHAHHVPDVHLVPDVPAPSLLDDAMVVLDPHDGSHVVDVSVRRRRAVLSQY
jgi:hypothetical protein